jgi:hypothetical protein
MTRVFGFPALPPNSYLLWTNLGRIIGAMVGVA